MPEPTRDPQEVQQHIISEAVPDTGEEDLYEVPGGEAEWVLKNQLIESLITNRDQRRTYAKRTFIITCFWISLVIIIVALSGIEIRVNNTSLRILKLSDTVIITLITTTTLNVFGFFLLVMKYLFNTEELKEMKDVFIRK